MKDHIDEGLIGFTDDETGLMDLLLEQAGTIAELSEEADEKHRAARRFDEGLLCLEMRLARMPAQNAAVLTPRQVLFLVGAVCQYGSCGLKAEWLGEMLEEAGR